MTIEDDSIRWAIDFLENHSDGDLFPKILEINAISTMKDDLAKAISCKDLLSIKPGSCRRFIVPKDDISYRQATQLDPQDSIILSALIYQYGSGIEQRRLPDSTVFSYRFSPDINIGLYSNKSAWNDFWDSALRESNNFSDILYCDIADFYNQIYHHTIENQLIASSFPNKAIKWIVSLLESTTAGVSRGVPVGPHPIHLIAEASMIPIDNSLLHKSIRFLRFADDIIIFCDSEKAAKKALSTVADTLDKQQRLMLQRHKTRIYKSEEFRKICRSMIEDRPISDDEEQVLTVIRKYSGGGPYSKVSYEKISNEDWKGLSGDLISNIIREYIRQGEIDYIRLRWFYRRLTQIGHPGAIEVSLEELENLGPCFANICTYLFSVQSLNPAQWLQIGDRLLNLLQSEEVQENEYFRLSILSLFTKNKQINHFPALAKSYQSSEPFVRREIILSAKQNLAFDWLREYKESYQNMDSWQRIAYIYGCSGFPKDERKYFLSRCNIERPFEEVLAKWSKQQ